MRVKEGKAGLKVCVKKKKKEYHGIWSHHFMANRRKKSGNSAFVSSKITVDGDCINKIKRCLFLRKKAMKNLVQFSSFLQSCPTLCDPMKLSMAGLLSITNSQSSPKPMFIESVMLSNHLILCCPLLLLPSIFPSIRIFPNESALHMERHTIVWNWKNQYYQNFYSIQGNLQIPSNPYQITNGNFHKLSQLKKKLGRHKRP